MTGFMSAPRWKQELVNFIAILGALGNERVAAIRNESGYAPVRRSLGTDAAYQHLENEANYGIYTVVDSSTRVLVFDLDDHKGDFALTDVIAKANEIAEALKGHNLFPMMFVSGGGAGVHIWVVFERKQSAAIVRRFGDIIAASVGLSVGTNGLVAGEVEVYPKQDRVDAEKLGNLIALPLGRKSRAIDASTLTPLALEDYDPPAPLNYFSGDVPNIAARNEKQGATNSKKRRRIERTAAEELETLAEALRHIDAGGFEQWVKVGLAIKYEFAEAGFDIWHRWSQSASDKYVDEADCRRHWDSLKPDGRVTLGSIYHLAKSGGWNGSRPYIAEKNRQYGILPIKQKTHILLKQPDERSLSVFETIGVRQLHDRHKPERIPRETGDGQLKLVPMSEAWFDDARASRYTWIDYDPDCPPGDNGTRWNLWRGFAVDPVPGRWDLFQDHLACNIANGNEDIFHWLLNWMAYGVQNPGAVIGTTPVLRGLPGTGKGTFAHGYGSLFGRHYIIVTQSDHVAGRFNAHFFARRFIFVDEGTFGGNRKDAGVLKTRITEDFVVLEQ